MSLLFADGFDFYGDAQVTDWWTQQNLTAGSISVGTGRNGTNSWDVGASGSAQGYISKTLVDRQTWIVGVAVKLIATAGLHTIISLYDNSSLQVDLRIRSDKRIEVYRNNTLLATGTAVLSLGNWWYIEMKAKIDNTTGTVEVRVQGVVDINISGVDTQNSANATADVVALGQKTSAGGQQMLFDDVYVCDNQGAKNNDFLGDVFVEALFPGAEGTTIEWTPLTGTDNAAMIDEHPPDDDATYNSDTLAVPGHIDTFQFGNMTTASGTVHGVIWAAYARKDDSGTRTIAPVIRHSGTNYVGTNQNIISTTYTYFSQVYENDPLGAAWTIASVNAAEFGYKAVA